MNINRVNETIRLMESVPDEHFDIRAWAYSDNGLPVTMKSIRHSCGTYACVAGWMGFHPPFRKAGLKTIDGKFYTTVQLSSNDGAILDEELAIAKFLDISCDIASALCGIRKDFEPIRRKLYGNLYYENIKPRHVVRALIKIRDKYSDTTYLE